jgi:hypothetical protein
LPAGLDRQSTLQVTHAAQIWHLCPHPWLRLLNKIFLAASRGRQFFGLLKRIACIQVVVQRHCAMASSVGIEYVYTRIQYIHTCIRVSSTHIRHILRQEWRRWSPCTPPQQQLPPDTAESSGVEDQPPCPGLWHSSSPSARSLSLSPSLALLLSHNLPLPSVH